MKVRASLFLSILLVGFFGLHAQINSTSSLSGTVLDSSGAIVPAAAVTVENTQTGTNFKVVTGANGGFTVPSLAAGAYSVTVVATGFKEARVANIVLEVGVPTNIQVKLEVVRQTETVTVEADTAILQTQTATVTTTLAGMQINSLPLVSREALDLV